MHGDDGRLGTTGRHIGEGVLVHAIVKSSQTGTQGTAQETAAAQGAGRIIAIDQRRVAFEAAQGFAETNAFCRYGEDQAAVAPAQRFDETQLAETIGYFDQMIVWNFELSGDLGNRNRRGAIMLAEIHEHAQSKVGKACELHGRTGF